MKRMQSIGHATSRRGGAVIIVVLALMTMLAFLGFFFYDFVQIEQGSARNFSEIGDFDPGSDTLIETGLIQIISHTDAAKYPQSAMVGGKLSLRASVQGTMKDDGTGKYLPHDREIRNGRGIRVIPTTPPRFVYTGNDSSPNPAVGGTTSSTPNLVLHRGGAANAATPGTALADTDSSYEPDVGYTYPDINSFWLAVDYLQNEDLDGSGVIDGSEVDLNGDGQANFARIIKPSFMDPDLFKAIETTTANWYQNPGTQQWSLRPHAEHVVVGDTSQKRFISNRFPKINGGSLALGPWTSSGEDYSGLDGDADGDGVRDSIYMDMGHPPMLGSNGRLLIPMFFWKIEDLNGLIDLNAAGNLAAYHEKNLSGTITLAADIKDHQMAGSPRPVHYSHYGLSRAEVNPMWALSSDPATAGFTAFPWNTAFYRSTGTTTYNRLQMQNTELAMLLLGSTTTLDGPVETTPTFFSNQSDDLAGRYGDSAQILTTASGNFSAPGVRGTDEDASEDSIVANGMLDPGEDTNGNGVLDGYLLPRGVHPTDSFGTGSIPINISASGARDLSGGSYPLPRYSGAWQLQAHTTNTYGTMVGSLVDTVLDLRRDDPGEINRYSDLGANNDNLFEAYEVASLHLSDYDFSRSSLFSRVRQLAPFNFNLAKESNTAIGARDIRRQFTTESWNRREFSFAYDPARDWEFNDADGSHRRFPPSFAGVASRHEMGVPGVDLDPFRPEIRRLLTTRSIRSTPAPARNRAFFPQLPIELNRILDDQPTASPAFDALGNPNFRQLTPHPNFRAAMSPSGNIEAMFHGNNTSALAPTHPARNFAARLTDKLVQEWWARYDRQRAARDMYVLLATLCSPGNQTDNVTTRDLETLSPGLAKEFAQFAVNYVDAFDEDDTITRFEYDDNLADGWNPTGALYVNGVEAQKLSINEVLWIKQKKATTADVASTYHNDSDGHHQFLYVELHNDTPFQVDFEAETWRLVRIDPTALTMNPDLDVTTAANQMARVEFHSDKVVNGGSNFVIAQHDGNVRIGTGPVAPSDFYANAVTTSTALEPIVPATGAGVEPGTTPPPAPLCDLDLCHPDHNGDFTVTPIDITGTTNTMATARMLYFDENNEDTATTQMVLSLQRRRNLWTNGNVTNLVESDWVEVDRFELDFETGNYLEIDDTGDEATELPTVKSTERFHPLDNRTDAAVDPNDLTPPQADRPNLANHSLNVPGSTATNTLSERGTLANTYARVWQPHHDRDLTSVYELTTIPICSPAQVLGRLRDHSKGVTVPGGINGWGNLSSFTPYAALTRFSPRAEAAPPTPDIIPWSRILNFVALTDPSDRVQRKLNPNTARTRTFGQININMIRSPSVLAGVLDETQILNPYSPALASNAAFSDNRSWWNDFKYLRDGGNAQGMAGLRSRPFLPPGQFHTNPASTPVHAAGVATEHGLLRHRYATYPPDGSESDFGLFEARSLSDFGNDDVDLHTRSRLLQKLANNTTTRSHLFAIWGGVDFFDAEESSAGSGTFKVGAKATDLPTCRWFFVVDMSRLEDLQDLGWATDWKKLIIHRQRLE